MASKIVNNLWLGNQDDSQNISFIKENGINVIINCTKQIPFPIIKDYKIAKYRLPIDDPGDLKLWDIDNVVMYAELPKLTQIISNHICAGGRVLVHCHAGMQRSAAVVLATIIRYGVWKNAKEGDDGMSVYKSAVNFIIEKRPVAFFGGLSVNFRPAIEKFAKNIKINVSH